MPQLAPHFCGKAGCRALTHTRYCTKHTESEKRNYDKTRGTSAQRGYGSAWQKARAYFLRSHPLCKECEGEGKVVAATVVDHIKPHKGNKKLFWDKLNWQSLCAPCHNRKTATHDGGFGN